jgi:cytoskeletal protein RodZ
MHTLDSADYPKPLTPQEFASPEESSRLEPTRPQKNVDKEQKTLRLVSDRDGVDNNMQLRNGSSESLVSTRSSNNSRPSSVSDSLVLRKPCALSVQDLIA